MKNIMIFLLLATAVLSSRILSASGDKTKMAHDGSTMFDSAWSWSPRSIFSTEYDGNGEATVGGQINKPLSRSAFANEMKLYIKDSSATYVAGCYSYEFESGRCRYCGENSFVHNNMCFMCNRETNGSGFKGSCWYNKNGSSTKTFSAETDLRGFPKVIIDGSMSTSEVNAHTKVWDSMSIGNVVVDLCIYHLDPSSPPKAHNDISLSHGENYTDFPVPGSSSFTYQYERTSGACRKMRTSMAGCQVANPDGNTCNGCWYDHNLQKNGSCLKSNVQWSGKNGMKDNKNACQNVFGFVGHGNSCVKIEWFA